MLKKLLAVIMALAMAMSLCVNVFAADETEIPLDADHVGQSSAGGVDVLTIENGSITASTDAAIPLFSLLLPEEVPIGETVTIHIKGTSNGDFRVWLLGNTYSGDKGVEATFSNQWKASENGFTAPGEFEKYITLTAEDFDAQGGTVGDRVAFKGPSYGVNLDNLQLTYVGVIMGTTEDIEAGAVEEAAPFLDSAKAALEAAEAATDKAGVEAALDQAKAAVASLEEAAALGFPGVVAMVDEAKEIVTKISGMINSVDADAVAASLQGDVEALAAAKEASAAAGDDVDAAQAALDSAKAALANIEAAAQANPSYTSVLTLLKDARSTVKEVEANLNAAKEAKAAADEAAKLAEEEAAAKKKTTTTVVIVVVVVVVVIAVIAAVALAMKKKKKN